MRELRLLVVFWVAFCTTVLGVVAATHAVPPWVRVLFALPGLVARSLGI